MSRKRILVVEDEMLIALDTLDVLTGAGYVAIGPATSLTAAVAKAETEALDGAVIDVNLGGSYVWPAAEVLAARRIPFVIATGFGAALDVPATFQSAPRLGKPIDAKQLLAALAHILPDGKG